MGRLKILRDRNGEVVVVEMISSLTAYEAGADQAEHSELLADLGTSEQVTEIQSLKRRCNTGSWNSFP